MTSEAESRLLHPSSSSERYGYFVEVSPFEGSHGVYDPEGLLIAVFPNLDAAIRRCRWLNAYKPKGR